MVMEFMLKHSNGDYLVSKVWQIQKLDLALWQEGDDRIFQLFFNEKVKAKKPCNHGDIILLDSENSSNKHQIFLFIFRTRYLKTYLMLPFSDPKF